MIENDEERAETCETCGCPINEEETNFGEGICDDCYEIEHEYDGKSQCDECHQWTDDNELADCGGLCETCHEKDEEINEAISEIKNGMSTLESYGYDVMGICDDIYNTMEKM